MVSLALPGKNLLRPEKMLMIVRQVDHHLRNMKREFQSGEIHENDVENADETQLVINMDNGKILGFDGSAKLSTLMLSREEEGLIWL